MTKFTFEITDEITTRLDSYLAQHNGENISRSGIQSL